MSNYKVSVTKTEIKQGTRHSSPTCPVTLAIKRTLGCVGSEPRITVCTYIDEIHIYNRGKLTKIDSPKSVNRFIKDFDAGIKVEPFNFILKIP